MEGYVTVMENKTLKSLHVSLNVNNSEGCLLSDTEKLVYPSGSNLTKNLGIYMNFQRTVQKTLGVRSGFWSTA